MKLYKITITPTSDFATTLKGDTLFGQLCWAIVYRFGKERLEVLLKEYRDNRPFLVISDAFAKGYLPKPKMPSRFLNEKSEDKKLNRKKLWLALDNLLKAEYSRAKRDDEIENSNTNMLNMHNALNYKSFHTGDGFDPYSIESSRLSQKDIYILLDENQLTLKEFEELFQLLSEMGYGKKTTIGKGRFEYKKTDIKAVELNSKAKTFMTLSPFSPKELECKNIYYDPFTRFGKFGGSRATQNAFKKPIILADVASVVIFEHEQTREYIGRAITGISDTHKDAVHQGYSIVLPLKELRDD